MPKSGFPPLSKADSDRLVLEFEVSLTRAILSCEPQDLCAMQMLGSALTRLGRHHEALAVDRRLVELAPDDDVAHYNFACSLSNLGKIDESLAALRRSVELGYENAEYMIKDPDLENARHDARFQDILDSIEAKKCGKPRG
jgi:tetratricopeptide (TPR) repeat protein